MQLVLLCSFSLSIASLVWARFCVFRIGSKREQLAAYIYDPIAVIHIFFSFYNFAISSDIPDFLEVSSLLLLMLGAILFTSSLLTTRTLQFASSGKNSAIIKSGSFHIVRHPFYVSYSCTWLATSILFNSLILWITLSSLLAFYAFSAKREEEAILRSNYSREYENYKSEVGMFFPRYTQWKHWTLRLLLKKNK